MEKIRFYLKSSAMGCGFHRFEIESLLGSQVSAGKMSHSLGRRGNPSVTL